MHGFHFSTLVAFPSLFLRQAGVRTFFGVFFGRANDNTYAGKDATLPTSVGNLFESIFSLKDLVNSRAEFGTLLPRLLLLLQRVDERLSEFGER